MPVSKKKVQSYNSVLGFLPFIGLIIIGFISVKFTVHQKVWKTMLIFYVDTILLLILGLTILKKIDLHQKKIKYLFYFALYYLYIFIQYLVSFFSKEISYDRNYYLANYTFLIILSLLFFLY
ncbi:MAG: hypothetical protein MJB14_22785, partial [Spirochaetes bacterium]|nr:hypothetical protein [Spirochaetota bacterium]